MVIVKLHGSRKNVGGIAAFQHSLKELDGRSNNVYFHFQTGRVATSRLQSVFFFRYLRLATSYIYFPLYLLYLRPDVIEINSSLVPGSLKRDYWYARIASFIVPKARLVLFNHGWDDAVKLRLLEDNESWLLRYFGLFDQIIVLASRFRRELRSMGVTTPVEVMTTGVDLNKFTNCPDSRDPEKKRVLFLSRLEKEKGIAEFLDAIPGLIARHPDLEVWIAGTGSEEDRIRTHFAVSAHRNNIRFFGYVRGDQKRNLLAGSDVFVLPSYSEGCPVAALEALAAGLPLIYTPVGALPDLLQNGANGIQIQPRSAKDVEAAVLHLLDNPRLMKEMRANNGVLCKAFDFNRIHKKLEQIYERRD